MILYYEKKNLNALNQLNINSYYEQQFINTENIS